MVKYKKTKTVEASNSYGALKSNNELYYQMASILKEVARSEIKDEDRLLKEIFNGFFPTNHMEETMGRSL